jgi:chromosome segregation ATPase
MEKRTEIIESIIKQFYPDVIDDTTYSRDAVRVICEIVWHAADSELSEKCELLESIKILDERLIKSEERCSQYFTRIKELEEKLIDINPDSAKELADNIEFNSILTKSLISEFKEKFKFKKEQVKELEKRLEFKKEELEEMEERLEYNKTVSDSTIKQLAEKLVQKDNQIELLKELLESRTCEIKKLEEQVKYEKYQHLYYNIS